MTCCGWAWLSPASPTKVSEIPVFPSGLLLISIQNIFKPLLIFLFRIVGEKMSATPYAHYPVSSHFQAFKKFKLSLTMTGKWSYAM